MNCHFVMLLITDKMADILKSAKIAKWKYQATEVCDLCRFDLHSQDSRCPDLDGELACNELDEVNGIRANEAHYFPKLTDILADL